MDRLDASSQDALRLLTVDQFCELAGISRSTYNDLKRQRLGPTEIRIGRAIRISIRSIRAWERMMEGGASSRPASAEAQPDAKRSVKTSKQERSNRDRRPRRNRRSKGSKRTR